MKSPSDKQQSNQPYNRLQRKCYKCESTEHTHWKCKAPKKESAVQPGERSGTKMVTSASSSPLDPFQYLHSDSDSASDVSSVRVEDKGSQPQKASVSVQGVPVEGVIDSGADITIMGADLFKKVAAVARLKKKQLKKSDKVPYTYDQKPFKLDGKLELDITFQDKTLCTPVYIYI